MGLKANHIAILKQLCKCNHKIRKEILKQGGKPLQQCLRECAVNVLRGNVPLSKRQLSSLKKHKKQLRELAKKKTSNKKRLQIEQRGGFLASLLLPIVGSIASAVISSAVKR